MPLNRLYNSLRSPLKLYWWRYDYPNKLNFGDEITPEIITKIWGRKVVWSPPSECEIAGAGSIIEILQELSSGNHVRVWGSGFIKPGVKNEYKNLDFYAVRGESTLNRIESNRSVSLGDPGLLASLIYRPSTKKVAKAGILAHYVDATHPSVLKAKASGFKIINPLDSPQKVAAEITSCEIVFSSSLHGLIVADSFNIPNYWLPFSDKLTGGNYKFKDYCSAIGRDLQTVGVEKLEDDLAIDDLISNYSTVRNLRTIQNGLISSFPFS